MGTWRARVCRACVMANELRARFKSAYEVHVRPRGFVCACLCARMCACVCMRPCVCACAYAACVCTYECVRVRVREPLRLVLVR